MDQTDRLNAYRKAAASFLDLLWKLEQDGHIHMMGRERLTDQLLPELQSYAAAVLSGDAAAQRLPGVYLALDRFDEMADAYDGTFYERMQVESPGRLTDYYLSLIEAYFQLAIAREEPDDGALYAQRSATALDALHRARTTGE